MNCSKYHFKNVWLVSGDGSDPRKGELLVSHDGKILSCNESFISCGKVIDGRGKLLVPGFIDVHGHSDLSVLANPGGFSKVSQGVTTEITGNCGLAPFPLTPQNREHLQDLYTNYGVDLCWHDYNSYLLHLAEKQVSPDIVPLCGHNSLRAAVAGYEKQPLSASGLDQMQAFLENMLVSGCPGMSTGLLYVPGKFASDGELICLMKLLARYDRIYTTHLSSEGNLLLESMQQVFELAGAASLKRLQISHFKTAGAANWHKLEAAIELIEQARRNGINVSVDRYPYTESVTQLSVILPGEWADMDDLAIQKKLQNREEQRHLAALIREMKTPDYWQKARLVSTGSASHRKFCGRIFAEFSDDPAALAVELLARDAAGSTAAFAVMSEQNLKRILQLDYCMPGSDGYAVDPEHGQGSHPRSWGTFPRFLRMLLEMDVPIGTCIRRATGLPAGTFGLTDRGVLAEGLRADLVLLDPDELEDCSTFAFPCTPARGIKMVFCKGNCIYRC